ncbi:MAG TPA: histidine phosphatase family protein [Kiloniellaceae bacterium]|nr:histidine phosphatase family protein [Kiloniellaceae bacterium]
MTLLLMLRHGPTAWNEAGRIQGRSDPPLSAAGRAAVAAWTLPHEAAGARWLSSPLGRARETAAILHRGSVAVEPRLIETDWGEWEGRTLPALRAALGEAMAANEARGLDFRPPGGESPRDVQDRLRPLLADLAEEPRTVVAISHKGVLRALYALASGWDLRGRPETKLRDGCAHLFVLAPGGHPTIERMNLPLRRAPAKEA